MKTLDLEPIKPTAVAFRQEPTALDMIASVIERGVTSENVAALRELVALKRDMDKDKAERDFAAAFVALQSDMPVIVAKTEIPKRGKYEKFEDLMPVVGPLLHKHGFSVSFSMTCDDTRITETCHLKHVGGHSQSNSFAVRVGKADSAAMADCGAATTAKRNALLNALNIVIRQDCMTEEYDAKIEGGFITEAEAESLRQRVQATGSDEKAFLRFAKASSYESISTSMLQVLDDNLRRKERTQ